MFLNNTIPYFLNNTIPYFSEVPDTNDIYFSEYEKIKFDLKINNDLYFFSPYEYNSYQNEVMRMNQFTLADYMDLIDIDKDSGFFTRVSEDLSNYTKNLNNINKNILLKNSDNISFHPAMEIDELIKSFKDILLNTDIIKMFISSGSIHAMRYSLVFDIFDRDELEIVKKHLKNMEITIIYGPFALLWEDNSNNFIKLLFELKCNFNLMLDTTNNYRNHFIYTFNKDSKCHSIIFETAHREYLVRRNIIEVRSNKNDFYDVIFLYVLDKELLTKYDKIISYNDFISSHFENIKTYFSFFKSSNRYDRFKELFNMNKGLL